MADKTVYQIAQSTVISGSDLVELGQVDGVERTANLSDIHDFIDENGVVDYYDGSASIFDYIITDSDLPTIPLDSLINKTVYLIFSTSGGNPLTASRKMILDLKTLENTVFFLDLTIELGNNYQTASTNYDRFTVFFADELKQTQNYNQASILVIETEAKQVLQLNSFKGKFTVKSVNSGEQLVLLKLN